MPSACSTRRASDAVSENSTLPVSSIASTITSRSGTASMRMMVSDVS